MCVHHPASPHENALLQIFASLFFWSDQHSAGAQEMVEIWSKDGQKMVKDGRKMFKDGQNMICKELFNLFTQNTLQCYHALVPVVAPCLVAIFHSSSNQNHLQIIDGWSNGKGTI